MNKCALSDNECDGKIEWHHAFIYAGRQINEEWSIIPLCEKHHSVAGNKEIKNKIMWIMVQNMKEEDFKKYPKVAWEQMVKYLANKYEMWKQKV